jgi:ssDNA-binding Zn-finger/Zn-ribbon topoisomerase 1
MRKNTECPDKLDLIIKSSNLVDFNVDLEIEDAVFKRIESEYISGITDKDLLNSDKFFTPYWFAVFDTCYKEFPDSYKLEKRKVCEVIYESAKSEKDFAKLNRLLNHYIDEYYTIRTNREYLLYLVEKFEKWRTGKDLRGEPQPLSNILTESHHILEILPRPKLIARLNDDGIVETKLEHIAEFAEAIDGIEFFRLRLCPICRKVYWASRLDKKACGKKCSDALSQSKYQKHNQDEINKRRRENYQYKKGLKKERK